MKSKLFIIFIFVTLFPVNSSSSISNKEKALLNVLINVLDVDIEAETIFETRKNIERNPNSVLLNFNNITYPYLLWGKPSEEIDKKQRIDEYLIKVKYNLYEYPKNSYYYDLDSYSEEDLKLIKDIFYQNLNNLDISYSDLSWTYKGYDISFFFTELEKSIYNHFNLITTSPKSSDSSIRIVMDKCHESVIKNNIDEFYTVHPEINIIFDFFECEEYKEKLEDSLKKEEDVDLVYIFPKGFSSLKKYKQELDHRDIFDIKYPKPIYCVPVSFYPSIVLFSNNTLLEELGLTVAKSYQELLEQNKIAKSLGKATIISNTYKINDIFSVIFSRYTTYDYVDDLINNRASFSNEPSLKSVKLFKDMLENDVLVFKENYTDFDTLNYIEAAKNMFNSGDALYYMSYSSADITLENNSINRFPSLPHEVNPNSQPISLSQGFAITKSASEHTEKMEKLKLLINFLIKKESHDLLNYLEKAGSKHLFSNPENFLEGGESISINELLGDSFFKDPLKDLVEGSISVSETLNILQEKKVYLDKNKSILENKALRSGR